MRITHVRLRLLLGTMPTTGEFWEDRLIRPLDVYPEHRAELVRAGKTQAVTARGYPVRSVFVEIETDEGLTGIGGPITEDIAFIIDRDFRWLLNGADALATERLWDKMYRHAIHGRKGTMMLAISAIDCALWDLRGKAAGLPVHRLLGGPVRETFPAYASALGYSLQPERVAERARMFTSQGYSAMKWFFRDGPTDGKPGMARNVALVQTLRDAVGPDVDLMMDAWSSWDVPYTVQMSERLEDLGLRWIEEPVFADKIAACAEIRRRSRVPIASGEHEYTRWGIKQLLDAGAVDILQPDIYWAGGISEMVKIAALASAYDIPLIPHGDSSMATAHFIAAQPPTLCPMLEYLVKWNDIYQHFFVHKLIPLKGMVTVPNRPGMGIELDPAMIEEEREVRWS